jgi:hypothetical protein
MPESIRQQLLRGEVVRVGTKLYGWCSDCQSVVRINKPIIGALHLCSDPLTSGDIMEKAPQTVTVPFPTICTECPKRFEKGDKAVLVTGRGCLCEDCAQK